MLCELIITLKEGMDEFDFAKHLKEILKDYVSSIQLKERNISADLVFDENDARHLFAVLQALYGDEHFKNFRFSWIIAKDTLIIRSSPKE